MSASKTDARVYTQSGPTDLRWVDTRPSTAEEIMAAAAQRTVLKFAGDAADLVLAALFGELNHTPKPRDNAGRWPRKEVSA